MLGGKLFSLIFVCMHANRCIAVFTLYPLNYLTNILTCTSNCVINNNIYINILNGGAVCVFAGISSLLLCFKSFKQSPANAQTPMSDWKNDVDH